MKQTLEDNSQNRRSKIMVISSLGPPPYIGGIENVIDVLLNSSLKDGYDFFTFDTYRKGDPSRSIFSKIAFALRLPFRCASQIIREKPSIAHIHFCSRIDFWKHTLCLFACKALNIKTVFHLHGGSFDNFYNSFGKTTQEGIKRIFSKADVVVALSQYWLEFLSNLSDKEKIRIVPNPINCEVLSKYVPSGKKPYSVVLLGSLGKRKGHFDILKAIPIVITQYPAAHFSFAGLEEDFGATEQLKSLAAEKNISDNISFLGAVSGDAKLKLLGQADIVILPSYAENMPISVLEGMAASKPVISTRVGAIPEVIEHGETGLLIEPGDWKDLSDKIQYLFANPAVSDEIGRKAGEKARETWDIKNIVSHLESIYELLLTNKKG